MLVATQSFSAEDPHRGTIQVTAGVTWMDPRHEIVRRFPDRFKSALNPLVPRESGRAASSCVPAPRRAPTPPAAAPGRWRRQPSAPPERRRVTLSTGPGTVGVQIYASALRELERLAARSDDGLECGGQLFGPRRFGTIEISQAEYMGPAAVRAHDSLTLDGVHDLHLAGELSRSSDGYIRVVGHWHTHPSGPGTPTPADLRVWSDKRRELGLQAFVGVIVTAKVRPVGGSRSFAYPRISCWVVRAAPFDLSDICERGR